MAGGLSEGSATESGPISSINITPFVDVVLVLLVIFIVTAPTLMKDVLQVNLPKAASSDAQANSSFAIVITRQGQILVDGQLTDLSQLAQKTRDLLSTQPETQAIIAADEDSKHGDIIKVIDTIKTAGIHRFALQIQH